MNVLSLFSGYGGLDLGLEMVFPEARVVCFCEIEPYAQKIIEKRFPGVPIMEDVYDLQGHGFVEAGIEIDCITAGFPCQPFSHAGVRAGLDDARGVLFWQITRIAGEIREAQGRLPMLLLENVRGLLSLRDTDPGRLGLGELVHWTILSDIYALGYRDIRWGVVGACHAGAPHRRERVFILAHAQDWEQSKQ